MTKYIIALLMVCNVAFANNVTVVRPDGTITICVPSGDVVICS